MNIIKILRISARFDTLIMSAGLIFAAIGCALLRGEMEFLPATLCFVFSCFVQLAGNYAHRYFDAMSRVDRDEEMIDEGLRPELNSISEREIAAVTGKASRVMLLLSATVGLALLTMSGWWTLVPAVLVYGLIYLNFGISRPVSRTPFASVVSFFLFGILGIGSAAMIQIVHDNPDPFAWYYLSPCVFTTLAMGFLAANVMLIHGYSFREADRLDGKHSFSEHFGGKAAINMVFFNGVAYLVLISVFVFTQHVNNLTADSRIPAVVSAVRAVGIEPSWIAFIVALVPFLWNCRMCGMMKEQKGDDHTDRIARLSMYSYLSAGILMCFFSLIFGDADRSRLMYIYGW